MQKDTTNPTTAFAKAEYPDPNGSSKKPQKLAIGFYNVENLFDTKDDPRSRDDDFTPSGKKEWTAFKYNKKVKKIAKVIAQIGAAESKTTPSLIGLAEVENARVIEDLIATKYLSQQAYAYVHRESPDERGIDVALLYKKEDFTVNEVSTASVHLETRQGVRDYTRDILHVKGSLRGQEVHLLINHWPSKRAGVKETEHKRIIAAQRNREVIEAIRYVEPEARIILMGDFNDGPQDVSVRDHLVQTDFYNPMVFLGTRYEGSLNHGWRWYIYDQIIFSNNFMRLHQNMLRYDTSGIFNASFLAQPKGKFKGFPFRSYAGADYLGGYSDHFPVYSILILNLG